MIWAENNSRRRTWGTTEVFTHRETISHGYTSRPDRRFDETAEQRERIFTEYDNTSSTRTIRPLVSNDDNIFDDKTRLRSKRFRRTDHVYSKLLLSTRRCY